MPSRNQGKIRRDINRLAEVVDRDAAAQPALAAIQPRVTAAAQQVNDGWQVFQQSVVVADNARVERDTAVDKLRKWVQRWRPVVLLAVPGAAPNIRALPPGGATHDDMIRVADDLQLFIVANDGAAAFRDAALAELGDGIAVARAASAGASTALPVEKQTRAAFTDACLAANDVLVPGTDIVRAIYGAASRQYKQFIGRRVGPTDDADDADDADDVADDDDERTLSEAEAS